MVELPGIRCLANVFRLSGFVRPLARQTCEPAPLVIISRAIERHYRNRPAGFLQSVETYEHVEHGGAGDAISTTGPADLRDSRLEL